MKTAVIGGGLLGIATAYELLERGNQVTLFEAKAGLGEETSFANGGMLTASMPDPWNGPGVLKHLVTSLIDPYSPMKLRISAIPSLVPWGLQFLRNSTLERYEHASKCNFLLADYSVRCTEAVSAKLGLAYNQSDRGTLKIFESHESMAGPLRLAKLLEDRGLRYEVLSVAEVVAKEPRLEAVKEKIQSALYFPDDRSGDAYLFVQALAGAFLESGGEVRLQTPVDEIVHEKGRFLGVRVSDGVMRFDRVILACGALSPNLARSAGVRLSIKPAKGYSVTLSTEGWNDQPRLPVIDDAMHAAVTPLGNKIRLAGTAEFTGFNRRVERSRIDNLYALFERLYPDLSQQVDRSKSSNWVGFRPMSADGVPYIGETSVKGLYINTGHSHLGWTMAMGSAQLLGQIVDGEAPLLDPTPYRVHR